MLTQLTHGATNEITDPTTDAVRDRKRKALAVGLKLLRSKVRHLGTEENLRIMKSIHDWLEKRIEMRFKTNVTDIIVEDNHVKGVILENGTRSICRQCCHCCW